MNLNNLRNKIICIVCAFVMVVSMCACAPSSGKSGSKTSDKTSTTTSASASASTPTSATEPQYDPSLPLWLQGRTVRGYTTDYEMNDQMIEQARANMAEGKLLCEADEDYAAFYAAYEKVEDFYYTLHYAYKMEELEYYMTGNAANQEKYLHFEEIFLEVEQWFNEIHHMAFKNSFKEALFEDMTDEEILDYIGAEMPDEYYTLKQEMDELEAEFYNLNEYSKFFERDAENLYDQYLAKAKEIKQYLGYENYLDYSYANIYSRDYLSADTDDYFSYVIEYALPAYIESKKEIEALRTKLTQEQKDKVNGLVGDDAFLNYFDYIEGYKEFMGGKFKEAFDNLFKENGRFYISYDVNGIETAFQTDVYPGGVRTPYVMYGQGVHDACTIVHEFGHYFADYVCENDDYLCYDLAETQSQADEFLFLHYVLNSDEYGFSNIEKEAVLTLKRANYTQMLILCALVNELEKVCYDLDDYEKGDMKAALHEIYTAYPDLVKFYGESDALFYATYVTMASPGYYISYSTSLMGAFYIDRLADSDFEAAKECYLKVVGTGGYTAYRAVYEYAGIIDPLSEAAFKYIFGAEDEAEAQAA